MTSNMNLTFLGTSDQMPSIKRNHTAILLNYNGENILVDCGEGTQRQFRIANLNPCKITRILITHWHGDHVFGLPGILSTLSLSGYNKKLFIYGPRGTKKFIDELLKMFNFTKNFEIDAKDVKGKFLETEDFYLEAEEMNHGIPCNAYSIVKKGHIRIDKAKLKKSGLPTGPLLQKIKEGKDLVHNGKKYLAKNLIFKDEDKKISIVLDTSFDKKIISFVKNSDLLVSESSFESELEERAREHLHLTAGQAGKIAKESNSKKLILTHLSQRYEYNTDKILNDAKKFFKNSHVAKDFDKFEV